MTQGLQDANRDLDTFGGRMQNAGRNIARMGAQMTVASLAIGAALTVPVGAAVRFDEALVNVQSITGQTDAEIASLSDTLLEMGANSRAGPQAVADSMYTIVSGVQDANTHMAILEASIRTAEAGNADLAATTDGLVSIMNAYNFAADDANVVSDVLTRTVQMGVGTMDEFVGALGPAAGVAVDVGIGLDELAASTAYLTTTGSSASESVTQLSAIMAAFLNPNETMKAAIEDLGYESGRAMLQQEGLAGAVQMLSNEVGGVDGDLARALGSTEAFAGGLGLMQDRAQSFSNAFVDGMEGVTESAREIQLDSPAAQMDLLKANVDALSIIIGQAFIPALNKIIPVITPIVAGIGEWIRANPEATATIAALTAGVMALGPVLAVAGAAITGLGAIIAALLSPIGLVVAAVGGLALAWETDFMGMKTFIEGSVFPAIATAFTWVSENIIPLIGDGINAMKDTINGVSEAISGGLQALQDAFSGVFSFIADNVIAPFIETVQSIVGIAEGVASAVGDIVDGAAGAVEDVGNAIGEVVHGEQTATMNVSTATDLATPFGGTRDSGGMGQPGKAYMIGTGAQPEMFVPSSAGQFIPANQQGGGDTYNVTINANSEGEGRAAARGFMEEFERRRRARGGR